MEGTTRAVRIGRKTTTGKPKALVLRVAGINCDRETKHAFEIAGAAADLVHINQIARGEKNMKDYHILAVPGGFSYGDDISAGKVLANELSLKIADQVDAFVAEGKLVIGICNGFQVLVKAGLLPGFDAAGGASGTGAQSLTVFDNDSGKFECRWVHLKMPADSPCVFTKGMTEIITLPVAHGEGKLIFDSKETRRRLWDNNQVVYQYTDAAGETGGYPINPNGSEDHIAGICNATGRVFGLMPHPERFVVPTQHPRWTRGEAGRKGDGIAIFENAVRFAKKELLPTGAIHNIHY